MNWIKPLINIAILILSTFLSLFFAEIIVRSFAPQVLSNSWIIKESTGLLMNKSKGSAIHAHSDETKVLYEFEGVGFRKLGIKPQENERPKILVVGDSWTFGWLLDNEDSYISKLAKKNNRFEYMNSAVGGWGLSKYTRYIENYCKTINPSKVYVFISNDDIARAIKSSLYEMENEKLVSNILPLNLKDRIKNFIRNLDFYQYLLINSHFITLTRNALLSLIDRYKEKKKQFENNLGTGILGISKEMNELSGIYDIHMSKIGNGSKKEAYKIGDALFKRLNSFIKECGAESHYFFIGGVDIDKSNDITSLYMSRVIKNDFFSKLNASFYNLENTPEMIEFREGRTEYLLYNDRHPNVHGADLIYRAIISSINE